MPWPQPERYRYLFDIEVLDEAAPPVPMSGAELLKATGLQTIRLGQFPRLEDEVALSRLRTLLARGRPSLR